MSVTAYVGLYPINAIVNPNLIPTSTGYFYNGVGNQVLVNSPVSELLEPSDSVWTTDDTPGGITCANGNFRLDTDGINPFSATLLLASQFYKFFNCYRFWTCYFKYRFRKFL